MNENITKLKSIQSSRDKHRRVCTAQKWDHPHLNPQLIARKIFICTRWKRSTNTSESKFSSCVKKIQQISFFYCKSMKGLLELGRVFAGSEWTSQRESAVVPTDAPPSLPPCSAPQHKYSMIMKKTSLLFYLSKSWSLTQLTLQSTLHSHWRGIKVQGYVVIVCVCIVPAYYKWVDVFVHMCVCVRERDFKWRDVAVIFYAFVYRQQNPWKDQMQQCIFYSSFIPPEDSRQFVGFNILMTTKFHTRQTMAQGWFRCFLLDLWMMRKNIGKFQANSTCITAAVDNGSRWILSCLDFLHPTKPLIFSQTTSDGYSNIRRGFYLLQESGHVCKRTWNTKSCARVKLTCSVRMFTGSSKRCLFLGHCWENISATKMLCLRVNKTNEILQSFTASTA